MMRTLALAVCSLAVVCLLVEVTLRATHLFNARLSWVQPDPDIAWRFTPGREYWFFNENDHPITGRINGMGWRDRERDFDKPAGVYRVAVLGDSFVEAFQVELDSTFLAITERRLNASAASRAADRRYELMNFGRSGMWQAEELIVLERDVLPCDPDLVVLLFTPQNDVRDAHPATALVGGGPFFFRVGRDSLSLDRSFAGRRGFRIRGWISPLKQHSALVSLLSERYNIWAQNRLRASAAATETGGLTREQRLCTSAPDSMFTENYTTCKALIARMARVCGTRGVPLVVLSVPLVYEREAEAAARSLDASFCIDFFDRDLAVLADSSGFAFVPLAEAFTARNRETGARLHWSHWNYAGHREVATVLARAIAGIAGGAAD